ncbi:MAG: class II aldolase/adducin family protein [Candidatus Velthaea sp.]
MMQTSERVSVYQPEQPGLIFPAEPRFGTFAEERRYRKERLVAAVRAFAAYGFSYGFAGHLTVRDPEYHDRYWTNPMAVHFSQVTLSNLICANHDGEVVEGSYALNRAGFVLHSAAHAANPDIVAMCHAHTVYGTAFAAMGRPLDPITQDAACFYEDHAVVNDAGGAVAVADDAGTGVAAAFASNRAVIHQNHGLITASRHSIDDAAFWFIALERCCQVQMLADAARTAPTMVSPERARYSREHVGSPFIGWLHFQPIYDRMVATNPDMFS